MVIYAMEKKTKGRRPKGGSNTYQDILRAAHALFSQVGYDRATIRAIAERANVDPSLVIQHFKSKELLFQQTMTPPAFAMTLLQVLHNAPTGMWGDALADLLTQPSFQDDLAAFLSSVIRVAVSERQAVMMLQTMYRQFFLAELSTLGLTHPDLRATMLASLIIGVLYTGTVIGLDGYVNASIPQKQVMARSIINAILSTTMPIEAESS